MFAFGQWKESLEYLNPPLILAFGIDLAVAVYHIHLVCFLVGGKGWKANRDGEVVEAAAQEQQQQQQQQQSQQQNLPMIVHDYGQNSQQQFQQQPMFSGVSSFEAF